MGQGLKKRAKPARVRHPMDVALGARIREVRLAQQPQVTLLWLARECRCSVTQIQKFEIGENRVVFSRLCEIAKGLDISVLELIAPLFKPPSGP